MKICKSCNAEKPLTEYHPRDNGNYRRDCKECVENKRKARLKKNREDPEWVYAYRDKETLRMQNKNATPYKKSRKTDNKNYNEKWPEKKAAHKAISKMRCSIIGYEMHHWSYNKEHHKDVIELSKKNHNLIHRYMSYDPDYMMYTTRTGVLLCTKNMHQEYINRIIEAKQYET